MATPLQVAGTTPATRATSFPAVGTTSAMVTQYPSVKYPGRVIATSPRTSSVHLSVKSPQSPPGSIKSLQSLQSPPGSQQRLVSSPVPVRVSGQYSAPTAMSSLPTSPTLPGRYETAASAYPLNRSTVPSNSSQGIPSVLPAKVLNVVYARPGQDQESNIVYVQPGEEVNSAASTGVDVADSKLNTDFSRTSSSRTDVGEKNADTFTTVGPEVLPEDNAKDGLQNDSLDELDWEAFKKDADNGKPRQGCFADCSVM